MSAFRPPVVVRVLHAILTFLYVMAWVFATALALLLAGAELFAGPEALSNFTLGVPAAIHVDTELPSSWGGKIEVHGVSPAVVLKVPMSVAPGAFRAAVYLATIAGGALILLFLHHLRQLFRRLRDGAPFDARNAERVRWLGVLVIVGELLLKVLGFWLSSLVMRTLAAGPLALGASFALDAKVILIGLMLVALAEVFRRGTTLEDEQSLVV